MNAGLTVAIIGEVVRTKSAFSPLAAAGNQVGQYSSTGPVSIPINIRKIRCYMARKKVR